LQSPSSWTGDLDEVQTELENIMKNLLVISTLSMALLSGVAMAQSTAPVVSGGVGSSGSVETAPAQPGANPTAEQVGEAINNAANDVGRVVNEAVNDVGRELNESAQPRGVAETSGQNEGQDDIKTAAISADSKLSVTLKSFGTDANAFFADENRMTLSSEPEFAAAFGQLSPERQMELRDACAEPGSGTLEADFCASISAM
jgi:hypothetical protein